MKMEEKKVKKEKKEKDIKKKDNKKCNCEECTCENCNCEEKIEELEKKLADMTELAARSQAEVLNFKKRKEEETSLRLKYCNEEILLKIVDICDNFERAIKMDDDDLSDEVSKFLEGFKMIYTHLLNILEAYEVKEVDVIGKEFDATTSEAVIVEHDDNKPSKVVLEVLRKGYMYKDKLLRPAMVKIND